MPARDAVAGLLKTSGSAKGGVGWGVVGPSVAIVGGVLKQQLNLFFSEVELCPRL